MLHKAVQGAPAPISTHEDLPPLSHEPAGGFLAECEEEVARLPPPPLTHENPEVLLVQRPQACVIETYDRRFSETYGLLFFVMSDSWRLSLHRLCALFTM